MTNWKAKQRRTDEVKERASAPDHMYGYCRVIGCGKPARAGTPDGLDMRFCRSHADHYQRHGSPYKGSIPAKVLNPYRKASLLWLKENADDVWVKDAARRVEGIYQRSGPHVEAFRLRGMSPGDRARAHWARLRKAEVDPRRVIAAWLAVEMAIRDDPQPVLTIEYKWVQAAKVVHRMASGTHKRWEREVPDPAWSGQKMKNIVQEMHIYPRSRGRVLRHIGQDLEKAVELLMDHHLGAVHTFKRERDKHAQIESRPVSLG